MKSQYSVLYTGFYAGCKESGKEKQPDLKGGYLKKGLPLCELESEPNILGVLADNVVMVDFDTQADAAAFARLMYSQGLKAPAMTTTKGKHFYFKATPEVVAKAYTHVQVACGLIADFKLGNKKGLDLIKFQGEMRQWENADAELIPLPKFLTVVDINANKPTSLTELTEGSRNATLFAYVGKLKRRGFSAEECHQLMMAINKYVLPKPLPKGEIDTICRPESYDGAYEGGSSEGEEKLSHVEIGKQLIAQHKLSVIGGALYGNMDGIYKRLGKDDFTNMVLDVDESLTINRRREVLEYCTARAKHYEPEEVMKRPELIPFANGVVDITTQTVAPFDAYDMPFTNRIDFNFPGPEVNVFEPLPVLDDFMHAITCGDGSRVQALYEMAGSCLYRKNALRGIFILVGDRANGKSTFLKFLNYCLGRDNVSNLSLHDLSNPFYLTAIEGKLANLGDDIGDNFVADSSVLKSIATSDCIMGNIKFRDPIMFTPYCTLIFTANFIPRISDPTGAVQNRLQFVKFEADFTSGADIGILERLCTPQNASIFLARAAWYYTRALSMGHYMPNQDTFGVAEEFSRSSNPILQFLDEIYRDRLSDLVGQEVSTVFDEFCRFCASERCNVMSRAMFSRRMKAAVKGLDIKVARVGERTARVFDGWKLALKD